MLSLDIIFHSRTVHIPELSIEESQLRFFSSPYSFIFPFLYYGPACTKNDRANAVPAATFELLQTSVGHMDIGPFLLGYETFPGHIFLSNSDNPIPVIHVDSGGSRSAHFT